MKKNIIIILLTAAVVLLLVNLLLGKIPPPVYGASNNWVVCPGTTCIVINGAGVAYLVAAQGGTKIGQISSFKSINGKAAAEAEPVQPISEREAAAGPFKPPTEIQGPQSR